MVPDPHGNWMTYYGQNVWAHLRRPWTLLLKQRARFHPVSTLREMRFHVAGEESSHVAGSCGDNDALSYMTAIYCPINESWQELARVGCQDVTAVGKSWQARVGDIRHQRHVILSR